MTTENTYRGEFDPAVTEALTRMKKIDVQALSDAQKGASRGR